jgi:transcriptional regulator with XRE-family HTH domain
VGETGLEPATSTVSWCLQAAPPGLIAPHGSRFPWGFQAAGSRGFTKRVTSTGVKRMVSLFQHPRSRTETKRMKRVATIAELLAGEMARRHLTDTDAAAVLGVSQPTISRWRSGKVHPPLAQAEALADFLALERSTMERMIRKESGVERPAVTSDRETLADILIACETEHGGAAETWKALGIDKSRYYRLRSSGSIPPLADLPVLAAKLGVTEERLVLAVYRTELARARSNRMTA